MFQDMRESSLCRRGDLQDCGGRADPAGEAVTGLILLAQREMPAAVTSPCFLIRAASTLSTRVGTSKGSQHRGRGAGPNRQMGRRGGKACCW